MILETIKIEELEHFAEIDTSSNTLGELKYLLDFIDKESLRLLRMSVTQDGAMMYRSQGAAMAFSELITQIRGAKKVVERVYERNRA